MDMKKRPCAEYRYWLYDPETCGMVYFRTKADRDVKAAAAIKGYLDGVWYSEDVEFVAAGELTHYAQILDKQMRPDELDEDNCDEDGIWWAEGMESMGTYTMAPLKIMREGE